MIENTFSKNHQARRQAAVFIFILLVAVLAQACGTPKLPDGARIIEDTPTKSIPTITPYVTATVPGPDLLTATASALQIHQGAVRFMSYNVKGKTQGDDISLLTSVLQAYNADILAIQEAGGWGADDFAIAKQVAGDLGMEYVHCQSGNAAVDANGNTFDVVLMSKLEIKNSEIYTDVDNCLIRAEVVTASGQVIQVFATQIPSDFDEVGCRNISNMAGIIEPFAEDAAILLGDMNMPPPGVLMGYSPIQIECPPLLEEAGWTFFTDVSQIEHVWATQAMLANQSYKLPNPINSPLVAKTTLRILSDHMPLAVDFYLP
jgi:endonuclease/exonuclease/phosphatase family metal-dependent hydrolase